MQRRKLGPNTNQCERFVGQLYVQFFDISLFDVEVSQRKTYKVVNSGPVGKSIDDTHCNSDDCDGNNRSDFESFRMSYRTVPS